jgi:transposase
VICHARIRSAAEAGWLQKLLERRPARLVSVALANKVARIARAVMARSETFRAPRLQQAV